MKYVITKPLNEIIIFSKSIQHSDFGNLNIKSAGFVDIIDNKYHCWGESISLGVSSDPEDSFIANMIL